MADFYTITYQTENQYDHPVVEANWQFLIVPQENNSQSKPTISFTTSESASWELSQNGFGFTTIRVRNRHSIKQIAFSASFSLYKQVVNPFDFNPELLKNIGRQELSNLKFQLRFDRYLYQTDRTKLPEGKQHFILNWELNLLDNLMALNSWVYSEIKYTPGFTHVDSALDEVLTWRKGVCQDFAHLFVGIARSYGIPARYVSGYLHQGQGFMGDAQMHAWVEAYVPEIGWIGFDPTNNILAATDHIKVCHGRDYEDCAPLKGVVFGPGTNTSVHKVQVLTQQ